MKFCDRVDNVQRLLDAYDRLRARSVDEVCFLVVEGRQGYGKTHAIHWWATRNGCPYVRSSTTWTPRRMLQALLKHLGCVRPPGDAGAVHGSCRRDAGCGAGTRRGGVRGLCTHHRRGRPHSAAEGTDGDGAGAGRPDRTSDRSGGQHRPGVSARHAPGILEEDMGAGGVQAGYDSRCRQSGALALQIRDIRRSGSLATQSERRANLCASSVRSAGSRTLCRTGRTGA